MAVDDWPLLRWRMREYTHGRWGTEIVRRNAELVAEEVIAAVTDLGPSYGGTDRGASWESDYRAAGKGPGGIAVIQSGSPRRCSPPGC